MREKARPCVSSSAPEALCLPEKKAAGLCDVLAIDLSS